MSCGAIRLPLHTTLKSTTLFTWIVRLSGTPLSDCQPLTTVHDHVMP
jgi:hypothetical protein